MLSKEIYVDDCLSRKKSGKDKIEEAGEFEIILNRKRLELKELNFQITAHLKI